MNMYLLQSDDEIAPDIIVDLEKVISIKFLRDSEGVYIVCLDLNHNEAAHAVFKTEISARKRLEEILRFSGCHVKESERMATAMGYKEINVSRKSIGQILAALQSDNTTEH